MSYSESHRSRLTLFADRLLPLISWSVKTDNQHATINRLFISKHVRDLRIITASALAMVIGVAIVSALYVSADAIAILLAPPDPKGGNPTAFMVILEEIKAFVIIIVPVLTAFGAILAWVYQAGSTRLGVVDLFASEISTLCRVNAVFDIARRRVEEFEQKRPCAQADASWEARHEFTSKENYFPVFECCARDLQSLEANVVINITAFYTYMKALRDALRALPKAAPSEGETLPSADALFPWQEGLRNVIYLMFLASECARRAVDDLVEFEPENAERSIVVLMTELEAYQFLVCRFPKEDDIHFRRLKLRYGDYKELVPELRHLVEDPKRSPDFRAADMKYWKQAQELLPRLMERYRKVESVCSHAYDGFSPESG